MTRIRQLHTQGREMIVTTTLAPQGTVTAPFMWGWAARQFSGQGDIEDDYRAAREAHEAAKQPPEQRKAVRGPW